MIPEDLKYTADHIWVRMTDDFTARCGLTFHAQESLGQIVFADLPVINSDCDAGAEIAVVESNKALTGIKSPLTGRITAVNQQLEDYPELINSDPYGEGWIFELYVKSSYEADDLLSAEEYSGLTEQG